MQKEKQGFKGLKRQNLGKHVRTIYFCTFKTKAHLVSSCGLAKPKPLQAQVPDASQTCRVGADSDCCSIVIEERRSSMVTKGKKFALDIEGAEN